MKERNALLWITTTTTTDSVSTAPTTTTIINNTDNSVINISEASNAKTTAKNISTANTLASRGTTLSNNS